MPYPSIGGDTPQSLSASPLPSLSEQDELNNDRFDHRLRLIKARTESVFGHFQVGVYITGRPGTGKTYTVKNTLDDLGANFQYLNCRVSPGGLYDKLKENPEAVIASSKMTLMEDVAGIAGCVEARAQDAGHESGPRERGVARPDPAPSSHCLPSR